MTLAELQDLFPSGPPVKLAPAWSVLIAALGHSTADRDIVAALVGAIAMVSGNHQQPVEVIDSAIAGLQQTRDLALRLMPAPTSGGLPS